MARLTTRDRLRRLISQQPIEREAFARSVGAEFSAHTVASDPHPQYVADAPADGKQYARQNGAWVEVSAVAMIAIGEYYLNLTGVDPASELGYGVWTLVSTSSILMA